MSNKNRILVGCLALLLVLSVGYALFSETVQINGTAKAQGDFDIEGTCEIVTASNAVSGNRYTKGGTATACKVENGVIITNSTLSKPSDQVWFRITLRNVGTIPAKLVTVDSPNNSSGYTTGTGDVAYKDSTYQLQAGYFLENYETGGGTMGDSQVEAMGITLQPNATESLIIAHLWYDALNQPAVPESGAIMNYNISLGFEQVAN